MSWYVSIGGQTYGPADIPTLREWHLAGTMAATDFAWDDASQAWVEAGRIPALGEVFREAPAPATGIADIEELPRGALLATESATTRNASCANHPDDASAAVCPRCQRSLCARCMAKIDGLAICTDCDAEQKNAATSSRKRLILTWGAPVLLVFFMLASYTIFHPAPAEQPPEPAVVPLERGEAPRLGPEDLTPEERLKVEADLRTLSSALAAWKIETPAAAAVLVRETPDSWIAILTAAGKLPAVPQTPRPDLLYRLGAGGTRLELWTAGPSGRAFLTLEDSQVILLPRVAAEADTAASSTRR